MNQDYVNNSLDYFNTLKNNTETKKGVKKEREENISKRSFI